MKKLDLFLELAQPDASGVSRWVRTTEFTGNYRALKLGNGGSWCRANSSLAKRFVIDFNKTITTGNSIDAIRLNGFNKKPTFNQSIRSDIRDFFSTQKCVMLGISGFSENTKIEIDHKDGRKNDWRISETSQQRIDDFQPLCKAANDVKRQICKKCKEQNRRWDAKNIKGNPYSFYQGNEEYSDDLGCVGCYQFDPVEYRKSSVRRISKEASDYIMKKLYSDN
ncbi:MAG TPA: hypothetical protein PK500_03760 [Candidatus Egerieousia sp.]|nr:hypothetical protein [Candidatus Egerieousia sp.]